MYVRAYIIVVLHELIEVCPLSTHHVTSDPHPALTYSFHPPSHAVPTPTPTATTPTEKSGDFSGKSTLQRRKEAFPTKLQNFKMMMARQGFVQGSRIKYNIRRDHLLEDAYEHIMKSDLKLLQMKRLNVTFKGEEGWVCVIMCGVCL